jgi:proteasome accessory factor B
VSAKVERLINLTVALLETPRPLSFAEIRERLRGYDHADPESARRMFERDKDELRALAIPIEAVHVGLGEGEWGYTIERAAYELPPLELAADEVAALAVAIDVAGVDRARLGLRKVGALAPDPRATAPPPAAIDTALGDLPGVAAAIVERRTLTFGYRDARGNDSRRTVDPYGLGHRNGAWYLVGWDHHREGLRVFRLDRLSDDPEPVGEPASFEPPDDLDVAREIRGPVAEGVAVTGAVAP